MTFTTFRYARWLVAAVLGAAIAATAPPASAAVTAGIQTSNPTPVAGGAAFSYTITLTNAASISTNVSAVDALPTNVVFYNLALANGASYSCEGPPVGTNGTVTCTSPSVPASNVATLTIVAAIAPDVRAGIRTNSVRVVSSGTESNASLQQNLVNAAALDLLVTAPATVIATNNVAYDIAVGNDGNTSAAFDVTVTNPLPPNTSFVSVAGTGAFHDACRFDPVANGIQCDAAVVPAGMHHVNLVVKTAKKPRTGTITNTTTLLAEIGSVPASPTNTVTTLVKK